MSDIKESFRCPISSEVMTDPVSTESGHTYDRKSIERWLRSNNRDPMTNEVLTSKQLRPNHSLRSMIQDYKQNNDSLSAKETTLTEQEKREYIELKEKEKSQSTELYKLQTEIENLKNQTKNIQNNTNSRDIPSYTNDNGYSETIFSYTQYNNVHVSGNRKVVLNGSLIAHNNSGPNINIGTNQTDENGNINCKNCRNCRNCKNCQNCVDCNDCQSCNNCVDCNDCQSCNNCVDCNDCQSCNNCVDCNDCQSCKKCRNLFDKTGCSNI